MSKQERSKKSTLSNTLATFQSANELPRPTVDLDDTELSYFNRVMTSREVSTWSDHDIAIATQIAQSHVLFQACVAEIKSVGLWVKNDRGTQVANPAGAMMNQLASSIRASSATLGLSASQRGVSGGKQQSRNEAEQTARKVIARAAEDDLLA